MKCEEYREAIAADPSFDGNAGHLSECAACQTYRKEMLALEQTIGRALRLDVPELEMPELPEIVAEESRESSTSMSDNVVALPNRRRVSPAWFAMAATVVVAALLGIRLLSTGVEYESLADEILAHVDHEPYALRVTDVAVSDERLASVVPANVAKMDHGAGLITYAQSCVINGHEVPHLVIQGERGPVTILLMPHEMILEAQILAGENVNGVILPVGNGSIAIIGESGESLERIQQQVMKSATWST
ncbi:MAG: DUF3379 domain-containing protein [Gammaproteobacteria bacterium]|nr:DUF3379 domain-containing protein [Gammaproteobacteria bacterium]